MSSKPRRRVLMLPPIDWLPYRRSQQPDVGPDMAALERLLAAEGVDVTILDPLAFPWNPLGRKHPLLRGIAPLRSLRVLLAHRRCDAVVAVFEGPALLPALLRRMLAFRPRLLMWDIGLTDSWRLRRRIQDLVVPRVDEILVLGSNQIAHIAGNWPTHAPVTCIGHYIDTDFFRPLPPGEGAGFVFSVGDDEGRDYDTLLRALSGVEGGVVIRSRQLRFPPARSGLRLISERIPFTELRRLYADAAVVVVPMHDRPHPGGVTTVLEAAAMGRAAVVSDSIGIRDFCRNDETCLLVPCGNAEAMSAAMRRLIGDPALRDRLGRNARAFVERSCSTAAFAARLAARLRVANRASASLHAMS